MTDIKVLGNRVLLKRDSPETKTAGGILLPPNSLKKTEAGEVLRVGPGITTVTGNKKTPGVLRGDHVLFTETGSNPIMLDDHECSFIDGTHIWAYKVTKQESPTFLCNCVEIIFQYQALRDIVFVLPSIPPKMIGKKDIIHLTKAGRKNHHDKTGMVLSAGPGYLDEETGKFHWVDERLKPGVTVKYDLSVPWNIWVKDTDGKAHYVSVCGHTDIHGIW